jgi:hypothetical protein
MPADRTAASDIDRRLDQLLDGHGIRPRGPRGPRVEQAVAAIWRDLAADASVLVWGDAEHTAELLRVVTPRDKTVVALTDLAPDHPEARALGYPVVAPDDVDARAFSVVVLSSFKQRAALVAQAPRRFPGCQVVDLYATLDARAPFYSCSEYVKLFELRRESEDAADEETRRRAVFDLVATYFEIRDFVTGMRHARDYIARGWDADSAMASFVAAVEALLAAIRTALRDRGQDVALLLVDAIRMKDVRPEDGEASAMPFLRAFSDRALTFVNAFSPTLYTVPAIPSMLTGRLPLDDLIYDKRTVGVDESGLLSALHARGYRFYNYVSWKDVFAGEARVTPIRVKATGDREALLSRALTPRLLWSFVSRLTAEDRATPTLSLLHLFYETHDPHMCGHHAERPVPHLFYEYLTESAPAPTKMAYRRQFRECLAYVDEQLAFYLDLLPPAMVTAVFGDHGQAAEDILVPPHTAGALLSWHDDRIRVACMVKGPRVSPGVRDGLFSMLDLWRVVLDAVDGTPAAAARDYVPVQCDPIYSPRLREIFASVGGEKFAKGFKLLRGRDDKYVLYDDGQEEYYVLPDEHTNRIDEPGQHEAVQRIARAMTNRAFPAFSRRRRSDRTS